MRITLEPMTAPDLALVTTIEEQSFSSPWPRESFVYELTNRTACNLCAKNGDQVVGYMVGWDVAPEFHLGNIAVHRDYRRQGIASLMLEHLMQSLHSRHYELITLEVRERNHPAIRLYTKFNFVPVAVRKNYYADTQENALVMIHYFPSPVAAAAPGPPPKTAILL